jgi:hypothetical protein
MPDALRDAIREQVGVRPVLLSLGLAATLVVVFDRSLVQVGTLVAITLTSAAFEAVSEAYDLRSEFERFGFGVMALVGAVSVRTLFDGPVWLAALVALVAGWFVLDAVQAFRHFGLTEDDARDGREVYEEYVARRVDETLRERAMTRRELSEALDADEATVDRAVATLDERGLLVREGSELRVDPPAAGGALTRVRETVRGALGRLARPLTVEFRDEQEGSDRRQSGDDVRNGAASRRTDREREESEEHETTDRR